MRFLLNFFTRPDDRLVPLFRLNGTLWLWHGGTRITYDDILIELGRDPAIVHTVVYSSPGSAGVLTRGQNCEFIPGMRIDAYLTNAS